MGKDLSCVAVLEHHLNRVKCLFLAEYLSTSQLPQLWLGSVVTACVTMACDTVISESDANCRLLRILSGRMI